MQTKFDIQYAALRQAIIEQEFSGLNERQREAVFATEGPLLVLAGAGSGKTTVIINRIANLLNYGRGYSYEYAPEDANEEDLEFLAGYLTNPSPDHAVRARGLCSVDSVRPWQILAITFTNKAANELKDRLRHVVGEEAQDIWALTFHAACMRILRRDIDKLGYDASFTIYDEEDKKRVIAAIIKRLNLDDKRFEPRSISGIISRAKDNLESPEEFIKGQSDYFKSTVYDIYREYSKTLKASNALDFDDIISKTVELFQAYPEVLEKYQRRFRYVLVDEYQDTNHAQSVLSALLAGGYENICVVGDDDQSIYKFRGAVITNILEFESHFPAAKTIRLEQNYRSTQNILSAANSLIQNNKGRKGKKLWTDNGDGTKVKLHKTDNQESEALYIAQQILNGYSSGDAFREYAVLYRNHVLSNNIEAAFKKSGIPYRIVSGIRFFDRAEVKDMLSYLSVIENPADTLRLKRIVNTPARKLGAKSIETAELTAARENTYLFDVLSRAEEFPELSRTASSMKKFAKMIFDLREMREFLPLDELYEELLFRSSYLEMLEEKNDVESQGKIENILELKSNIVDYINKTEEPSLAGFLEEMALFTEFDKLDSEADAVVMMTIHSAKGLEFPYVFICGMEDGVFPGFRAGETEEEMEEERRLCYVAMTRAKRQLYLTCAERRMMYGSTRFSMPSRFLNEIPKEYMDSNISEKAFVQTESRATFRAPKAVYPSMLTSNHREASAAVKQYRPGDSVVHKSFGKGMIVSAKEMGGDCLLEIAFDGVGTKRLMAKVASQFLKKME